MIGEWEQGTSSRSLASMSCMYHAFLLQYLHNAVHFMYNDGQLMSKHNARTDLEIILTYSDPGAVQVAWE